MDWTRGYTATWRVFEVNVDTWADGGLLSNITSASISRDCTGGTPLLESGSIKLDAPVGEDFTERYLRIVMTANQDGQAERVDIATLLCSSSSGSIDRGYDAQDLEGHSVLYPASTRLLTRGTYVPAGTDGVAWAADMLRQACRAPIEPQGAFTLEDSIVFDIGTSYLECVWMVLDAGGYCMQIEGDGTVNILPLPATPGLVLDGAGAQLITTGIDYTRDWAETPNRYVAVDGENIAEIVNDDPNSPTSTVARGYFIDEVDTSPVRVNGESLQQYAIRRLEELSTIPDERTYTREYAPGVYPFSLVRGTLADVSIEGDLRVKTQSLECGRGILVTEKAERQVFAWQAT